MSYTLWGQKCAWELRILYNVLFSLSYLNCMLIIVNEIILLPLVLFLWLFHNHLISINSAFFEIIQMTAVLCILLKLWWTSWCSGNKKGCQCYCLLNQLTGNHTQSYKMFLFTCFTPCSTQYLELQHIRWPFIAWGNRSMPVLLLPLSAYSFIYFFVWLFDFIFLSFLDYGQTRCAIWLGTNFAVSRNHVLPSV